MAQHYGVYTILDYSNEKSPLKFFNGAITATSIAGYVTDLGSFRTLTQNLILGVVATEMWVGDSTQISSTPPTDPDAQRERKGLVVYQGDVSAKKFTLTIPTIRTKTSGGVSLIVPGTDKFDLTKTLVSEWITGFESIGRSPDSDTEGVTVLEIRLVGRNI